MKKPLGKRIVYGKVKDAISYNIGYDRGYGIKATALIARERAVRKQTLEEVLKEIKKYKLFWKGQKDTFNFSKEMRFNLMHQLDLIEKYLEQKIKELSK